MPKLPVVNGRETVRALRRAGFVIERQSASHAILVNYHTDREVSVPMHGGRDLAPGTLRGIISDAGLTVDEFRVLLK